MTNRIELRQMWLVNKIPILAEDYEEAIDIYKEYCRLQSWEFHIATLEKIVSNNLAGKVILKSK
jgi:hypothetical protein